MKPWLVYFATGGGGSHTGVGRGCAPKSEDMCTKYNHEPVPEFGIFEFTGEICFCTTDLCNSAPRNSAPQTSIGHLMVSFIGVVSLLALTTARLLSE